MLERLSEILKRPGAERALTKVIAREERERERAKDGERARLREEREVLLDELAVGRAALLCAVKDADEALSRAKKVQEDALRVKFRAERELSDFERPLRRRLSRIEGELARRPIALLASLRQTIADARHQLGAPPSWAMDPNVSGMEFYRRSDRLTEIEREVFELEEGDSARAELLAPAIERSILHATRA